MLCSYRWLTASPPAAFELLRSAAAAAAPTGDGSPPQSADGLETHTLCPVGSGHTHTHTDGNRHETLCFGGVESD